MLTIGEWISFLNSEKHSNTSYVIGFGRFILAVAVAAIAVRVGTGNGGATLIVTILLTLGLAYIFFKSVIPLRRTTEAASKLLNDIMDGTERDIEKIEARWKDEIERRKQRRSKWYNFN